MKTIRLLFFVLLLGLPAGVQGQYTCTTNNGTLTITAYTGPGGAVTIPATINGWPVTSLGGIGHREAFSECPTLTSVTISNNIVSIGPGEFMGCPNLTNVLIADEVTNIGPGAFALCTALAAIIVDTNNRAYSSVDGVLFNQNQTTLIQYPAALLGSYQIPGTVTNIGSESFLNTFLTNITIPNSVTTIGLAAFNQGTNLVSILIPKSVISIGSWPFGGCTSLTDITVDTNNPAYSSVAGVLFDKQQTTLIQYPEAGLGSYTIPNDVSSIADNAFAICTGLTSVMIPNSVTTLGFGAFNECTSLTNIVIPNQVTSLGDNTFDDCTSLTSISIGNSVTNIGVATFTFCTNLLSVTIPDGVVSIGNQAFTDCYSLTNVTIPDSVSSIGDDAFSNTGLTNVTFGKNVTTIGVYAFAGCSSLTGVYFQGNAPAVDPTVFGYDGDVTAYYLPGTTGWDVFSTNAMIATLPWFLPNPLILNSEPGFGVQNNAFDFTISWATNVPIVVEACTNLGSPVWQPVQTNTLSGGTSCFSDSLWINYPMRFYRLSSP
jgi:hypothetical protein